MKKIFTIGLMVASLGVAANAATIKQREENQKDRIHQGVKSGELTKGEAARLRADEAKLHYDVAKDRVTGGGLSDRERAKLQAQENHDSRVIHRLKHNDRTQ